MAKVPGLLKGYLALAAIFNNPALSLTERQTVVMTVSRFKGSYYPMAAHSVIARMQGVPRHVTSALRAVTMRARQPRSA